MKIALVLPLSILMCSCASVGSKFDTAHIKDVAKGVQDKAQIQAWFGEPNGMSTQTADSNGCVETWQWNYAEATMFGSGSGETLAIAFDKDGKVCDSGYAKSKM